MSAEQTRVYVVLTPFGVRRQFTSPWAFESYLNYWDKHGFKTRTWNGPDHCTLHHEDVL
jgi:hypothetical protein